MPYLKTYYSAILFSAGVEVVEFEPHYCSIADQIVVSRSDEVIDPTLSEYYFGYHSNTGHQMLPPKRGYHMRIMVIPTPAIEEDLYVDLHQRPVAQGRIKFRSVTAVGNNSSQFVRLSLSCNWSEIEPDIFIDVITSLSKSERVVIMASLHSALVFQRPWVPIKKGLGIETRQGFGEYDIFSDCVHDDGACREVATLLHSLRPIDQ